MKTTNEYVCTVREVRPNVYGLPVLRFERADGAEGELVVTGREVVEDHAWDEVDVGDVVRLTVEVARRRK